MVKTWWPAWRFARVEKRGDRIAADPFGSPLLAASATSRLCALSSARLHMAAHSAIIEKSLWEDESAYKLQSKGGHKSFPLSGWPYPKQVPKRLL
jgi:hypothetical protein